MVWNQSAVRYLSLGQVHLQVAALLALGAALYTQTSQADKASP